MFLEILHRYTAIHRKDAIGPAFDALEGIVDEVFSIHHADLRVARTIVEEQQAVSARDAIHVAVMKREGIGTIFSFDSGFDGLAPIRRVW